MLCEDGLAGTEHDRIQVDPVLVDEAEFGEAAGQSGSAKLHITFVPGIQPADGAVEIVVDERGVRRNRLRRSGNDPCGLLRQAAASATPSSLHRGSSSSQKGITSYR